MRATRNILIAACSASGLLAAPAMAESFVMLSKGSHLPANFEVQVKAAGGHITTLLPEIGVAIVESDNPDFKSQGAGISGIQGVATNVAVRMIDPGQLVPLADADFANPPTSGEDDFFFDLQWGHQAIDAAGAWNAGYRGAGVRVAVLDSGIDADNPDLEPNLNKALSTSFVPGEGYDIRPGRYFNHGTHVAGTIAAADNGFGTIGVAPEAELVAVKVLSEFSGSGSFGGIAAGIVYAANIDADVINMSLGATIPHNCTFDVLDDDGNPTGETVHFPAWECAHLLTALNRATTYAHNQGSTIIVSAGNEATDMDHNQSDVKVPAEMAYVQSISATAPIGWALDPFNTPFDNLASYSNFGKTGIDFSAPGGDTAYPGNELCVVGGILHFCFVFDLVFSTSSDGAYFWSGGTSMAAPHVSGVAALIIGKNGGSMAPADVVAELKRTALDLGEHGDDDVHGDGAVNASTAVN